MKKVIFKIVYILFFLFCAGSFIAFTFFAPEKDYSRIVQSALLTIAFGMKLFGVRKRSLRPNYRLYEEAYKDFIRGAFVGDKKNYRRLMEAAACFNRDEIKKAHKLLDKLEKECRNSGDYVAVYMFRSMIYEEQNRMDLSIATYEKLLQYDMTNSLVWSNLGLLYRKRGRMPEAFEAYSNAIRFDPQNETAYANMAYYYLYDRNAQKMLEYALKSLEMQPDLTQGLKAASVAYKLLGDETSAEQYCVKYVESGGDEKEFRKYLAQL